MKTEAAEVNNSEIYEDVWIPTQCRRCQAMCGILAHRVNGVIVKLEGIPDSYAGSRGGLCSKGLAGIQLLYDPNRLKVPLRRTNPEKGIGVDPRWQEISWDEALDEIATRLKKVMEDDPSKIAIQGGISVGGTMLGRMLLAEILSTSKGSAFRFEGAGIVCGNAGHFANAAFHGAFVQMPDWKHCNYQLQFGTSAGHGHFWQYSNRLATEAMERGMKLVVFDPVCGYAASKATEWVPLIPGTDAVVALAMCNVIVNELGIYDAVYLKYKTDASYLVGPDGRFVRDKDTKKPMVWDTTESKAKVYDDPGIGDIDLDGSHEVNGIECRPAWQLMKEHFKKYPVERASEISGVPAETIRRIATEFARAAMVGATITIAGKQYPFRPAGTLHIRAAVYHKNATNTIHAIELLPHILGASDVPGGNIAVAAEFQGYPGTGLPHSEVCASTDGYLTNTGLIHRTPFPPPEPRRPRHKDLTDLFPMGLDGTPLYGVSDGEEIWQKANIDPAIEVLFSGGKNDLLSSEKPSHVAEILKKIPFIVDFELFPNEFNDGFADILLPDTCFLEYSDWGGIENRFHNQPPVPEDDWCLHITQKVVEPMYSRRHSAQVVIEILDRMGLRARVNEFINNFLRFDENFKLKPDEKVEWEDLCDRYVRYNFGPERDWAWFKKHGFITWPKKPEEVYWKYLRDARVPLYWEFLINQGEKTKKIGQELGIELDWEHYSALPEWFPIPPHLVTNPQYDLYCFNVCDSLHAGSATSEQPWLDEAGRMNPYTYNIAMNAGVARQKGLKDGDTIEVESDKGNKVQGVLKVREGQHPQTLVVMGRAGHWSPSMPVARGKGIGFQFLMDNRLRDCDPITWHPEPCVKVKVTKVK